MHTNLIGAKAARLTRLPFFGRNLFAGRGGNLEYMDFAAVRSVRVIGSYRQTLISAEICGDSLSEAGIYDGDVAVIELTNDIKDGEIVAVLTPHGMMAKFFYRELDGTIRLESRNRKHAAMNFTSTQVSVQGVVREIVRQFR